MKPILTKQSIPKRTKSKYQAFYNALDEATDGYWVKLVDMDYKQVASIRTRLSRMKAWGKIETVVIGDGEQVTFMARKVNENAH